MSEKPERRIAKLIRDMSQHAVKISGDGKVRLGRVTDTAPLSIALMGTRQSIPHNLLLWTDGALVTRDDWAVGDTVLLAETNSTQLAVIDVLGTGTVLGGAGGGGGGSTTLADLTDTTITSPVEHSALLFDGSAWVDGLISNANIAAGASIALSKLAETVATQAALDTHKTSTDHDGRYYTETEMDGQLAFKSDITHDHDTRYYTKTQADILLAANATDDRDRTNHTGEQAISTVTGLQTALDGKAALSHIHTASEVTDFNTAVRTNRLDQMATPAAAVAMGNNKLTSLAAATANGDALRYEQAVRLVDAQTVAGIKTFSSIPVLPASDPTTDNQAGRKKYIDDAIAAAVGKKYAIATATGTGNQTHTTSIGLEATVDTVAEESDDTILDVVVASNKIVIKDPGSGVTRLYKAIGWVYWLANTTGGRNITLNGMGSSGAMVTHGAASAGAIRQQIISYLSFTGGSGDRAVTMTTMQTSGGNLNSSERFLQVVCLGDLP